MKQNFIKSLMMLVLCLVFGTSAAHVIVVDNSHASKNVGVKPNIDMTKYEKRTLKNGKEVYAPKHDNSSKKLNADEAELVNVTFRLSYDPALFSPYPSLMVIGDNFSENLWMDNDENNSYYLECQIPVGTYDFFAMAFSLETGWAFNVKELVQLTQDTTITFDFAECNIKYSFKTFKPSGEEATLDVGQFNKVITPGNSRNITDNIYLILKGHGIVIRDFCSADYEAYGKNPTSTVFLNNVSNRYKLASERMVTDDNGIYIVRYEANDICETQLENNPEKYVLYEEEFTSMGNDNNDLYQGVDLITMIDNANHGGISFDTSMPISSPVTRFYVDPNRKDGNESDKFDILIQPKFKDNVFEKEATIVYDFDWETFEEIQYIDSIPMYRTVTGLPVLIDNDGSMEYVNASHDACGNYSFHITEGNEDVIEYPGHPQFSFTGENKALDFGSNSPICSVMAQNTEGVYMEGKYSYIAPCFIGRYGEVIGGYYDINIKYNGETITNNCLMAGQDMSQFFAQGHPDGVITAHFESHNAVVDGLQGSNVTDVYYDQRQADWTAPTLQMLTFKDHQGKISDRFATADEGILEFAGGDFNFQIDMETYQSWFDCKEQTVEVSYSPYCADQWLALDVEEVPGEFYMPGFGYFYRGSLEDVTNPSATGWYDLRIKLTDASGNWQEQVISPAFRIGTGSPAGIEVVTSCDATEVARYTIDGRAISAPQAGVNIVMMSDGTVKKVLVK